VTDANSREHPRRSQTDIVLREATLLPGQEELTAISNALDAALGYSPLREAPRRSDDAFAYVTRLVAERFWEDIYVSRPEIRRIIAELDKGQIVILTGERGTGKSTAIQAAMRLYRDAGLEGSTPLPFVFDANRFEADLMTREAAEATIHRVVREQLRKLVREADPTTEHGWLAYLYENDSVFQPFQFRVANDGFSLATPADWQTLASMPEYATTIQDGIDRFVEQSPSRQLRSFLDFLHHRTEYAVILIIDNIDQLPNDIQRYAAKVLARIIASTSGRVRGGIAVRPENYGPIQSELDTAPRPPHIPLTVSSWVHEDLARPTEELTVQFIERRMAVVRAPETLKAILGGIPTDRAASLATSAALPGHTSVEAYFDVLERLLDQMVFDVFRGQSTDDHPRKNESFIEFIHLWHNGSLRECARCLVAFVEDLLQDKSHMFHLQELMKKVVEAPDDSALRHTLRRVARSFLYRHLLFWGSADGLTAPENVMVFDAIEEDTNPPIYFLRLRILQYLADQNSGGTALPTVEDIRRDLGRLEIRPERVDEILVRLASQRFRDDGGLVRIDDHEQGRSDLKGEAEVRILDAGLFLVQRLCLSTEYLFWSAVSPRASQRQRGTPKKITDSEIQRDSFRSEVAANFLATDVVGKFKEEHPYWNGEVPGWTQEDARRRLMVYSNLFGFSRNDWFLDRCCSQMRGFIGQGANTEYESAKQSIQRVRTFTEKLNQAARPRTH
jgi:hypothetical protein